MSLLAGYELTFTNQTLIAAGAAHGDHDADVGANILACGAFARRIRATIGEHRYDVVDDGHGLPLHEITYADGYRIHVESDPWVVEITGDPLTLAGYEANHARFAHLFACAASVGLAPHERIGGGHIHLDRASFGSPRALRNFIVDYVNRPELALGVQGYDLLNAPPLALGPRAAQRAFADGLAAFDAGELDLDGWLHHIRDKVYTFASRRLPAAANPAKYHAINVSHPSTIEIRAIRPQASADALCAIVRSFDARAAELADAPPVPFTLLR